MSDRTLSNEFLQRFVETVAGELGRDTLTSVLEKAGLPADWSSPECGGALSGVETAEAYAGLQKAMRTYYGRGARNILLRVGSNLWDSLLDNAPLPLKAQSKLVRGRSIQVRRKAALELLAKLMENQRGDITVHNLEIDLILTDHTSPGTLGQTESENICYVTLGLLRECLFWATEQEHDIEETSCRANGGNTCEFKIIFG